MTPPRVKRYAAGRARALGIATRGTTNPQRLRRVDRWLLATHARLLTDAVAPVVVDLGFGATPVTTLELADRLSALRSDVLVVGVEIDPERVAAALPSVRDGVQFMVGGYETPTPDGQPATVIRAFNVLRQYDEPAVAPAWAAMQARLAEGGLLIEGTCDEPGRLSTWITLDADRPRSLTLAAALEHLDRPATLAERLPKALIHRNVAGEPVHELIAALDHAWDVAAPVGVHGPRQRWVATCQALTDAGWPVQDTAKRWRHGELTVDWACVAPRTI